MASDPSARDDADLPRAEAGVPQGCGCGAFYEISNHLAVHAPRSAGFLKSAENRLSVLSQEIAARLGCKAIDISGERGASAVDVADVDSAYRCVIGNIESERQAWLLGIGTLAGGAALGAGIAIALSPGLVSGALFWWIGVGLLATVSTILLYLTWPRRKHR